MNNLINRIPGMLSEYLEFDVQKIIIPEAYVYGGCIRDVLSGTNIENDVDILCSRQSAEKLRVILQENGYKYKGLVKREMYEMYKEIKHIHDPDVLVKGSKMIQLVIPRIYNSKMTNEAVLRYFVESVDVNCCSNSYSMHGFIEHNNSAIHDCINKLIVRNRFGIFYSENRYEVRKNNLIRKGWRDPIKRNSYTNPFENTDEDKHEERYLKLRNVSSDDTFLQKIPIYEFNAISKYFGFNQKPQESISDEMLLF